MKKLILVCLLCLPMLIFAQTSSISGTILDEDKQAIGFVNLGVKGLTNGAVSDELGQFEITGLEAGTYTLLISSIGYSAKEVSIAVKKGEKKQLTITLKPTSYTGEDVVVSGTLSPVSRKNSPVAIEVYQPKFFLKNPTPNLFESLQIVNGVRPQINCNICNTGDIHINGLEGPYTMITIDGMPIVSGLATVYGLNGIPNSLIERLEVVKGPASTLYGSEAVGGLINVITKHPDFVPALSIDAFATDWGESNLDVGIGYKTGKVHHILGINGYWYNSPKDKNGDGFTDIALAKRASLFQKSSWKRKAGIASIGLRYVGENRWGGQTHWNSTWRGSDSIYAEDIQTNRIELMGVIPFQVGTEIIRWQFSGSMHVQDSYYGNMAFLGDQKIGFTQLLWNKKLGIRHQLVSGLSLRYTYYDDNTVATESRNQNRPSQTWLPGLFIQDEWSISSMHTLLAGFRYDQNSLHGGILSPRLNYKWRFNDDAQLRLGVGNGYRVANIFTEDHAALTGARDVVFKESIQPEKSWNANANYRQYVNLKKSVIILELGVFYTHFSNKIIPDFLSDPTKIIYSNLDGYAVSQGINGNINWTFEFPFSLQTGFTWMDVYQMTPTSEGYEKQRQLLTERFSGTWTASYTWKKKWTVDYSGNVYAPMLLPTLGPLDPRPNQSPWYSIQNLQLSFSTKRWTFYGGIKNILDFVPRADAIARAFDPFDKGVSFDQNGQAIATPNNPNALTFDPSYVYTSNQGRRYFLGFRFMLQ